MWNQIRVSSVHIETAAYARASKHVNNVSQPMSIGFKFINEVFKTAESASRGAQTLKSAAQNKKAIDVARVAVQNGPAKEIALLCGRAGVAGAVVDGGMGAVRAFKGVRDGKLDGAGAAKHIAAETGCGFITSSSGTAGTIAAYMLTGTMGPAALVAGMGASMGSRWAYRKVVGETFPEDGGSDDRKRDDEDHTNDLEEIGPKPLD